MRTSALLCFVLTLGTSSLVAHAQAPVLSHAKLLSCDGLPCIDAVANGHPLRLAIDTGNPNPVLNLKSAQDLSLKLEPVLGPDGKPYKGYFETHLATLTFGDTALTNVEYLVADLTSAIAAKTFPDIDGTIGYGALKDRIVQLDYPGGVLGLSQPLATPAPCPGSCGEIALITFGHHGPPIVTATGFTVNGKPITVQIDTMYSGSLLIFPTSVDKLGLATESQSKTSKHFAFTDGGVDMLQSQAKQVGFITKTLAAPSPLYFAGPKVHLPDGLFDGTVGAELLSPHKVTFDFHDNKFWLD